MQGEIALAPTAFRPVPSPHGDMFVYYQPALGNVAFLAGRDGRDLGRLPGDGHWGPVSWSADGSRLCYYTRSDALDADPVRGRVVVYCPGDGSTLTFPLDGVPAASVEPRPVFFYDGLQLRVFCRDGVWTAPAAGGELVRDDFGLGVGDAPCAVSNQGRLARRGANPDWVEVGAGDDVRRTSLAGNVTDLSFFGDRLAVTTYDGTEYRLYIVPETYQGKLTLVEQGAGEASSLSWSAEGRFIAFQVNAPAGAAMHVVDLAQRAAATFAPGGGLSGVAWLDPYTVIALAPAADRTWGCLLAVGDPPRPTAAQVEEWRSDSGLSQPQEYPCSAGLRLIVSRGSFAVGVKYDRAILADEVLPLLACSPGPAPETRCAIYDGFSMIHARFVDGIPVGSQVSLVVAGVRGGEAVDLIIARVAEPLVAVQSRDRPELASAPAYYGVIGEFFFTLSNGPQTFDIQFSLPMDRESVEAALRQHLGAADSVSLKWLDDRSLELVVTCTRDTRGLNVDAEGALSRNGVAVWEQPSFPYNTLKPYRLRETRPDGGDMREIGLIAANVGSFLPSPDGERVIIAEEMGYGDDSSVTWYWARAVNGGPPTRLLAEPVGWLPDSRHVVGGLDLVDARTGAVLRGLPGEKPPNRWRGALSRSGRWLAILAPESGRQRLSLYDLEAWNVRDCGIVGGDYISDGFTHIVSPTWSPDEKRLAFTDTESRGEGRLVILDVATGQRAEVPCEGRDGDPAAPLWSPDGRHILWAGRTGWRLVTPDGRVPWMLGEGVQLMSALWSPDGSRLLFATRGVSGGDGVYVLDVDAGTQTFLGPGIPLGWSGDGSRVRWMARE